MITITCEIADVTFPFASCVPKSHPTGSLQFSIEAEEHLSPGFRGDTYAGHSSQSRDWRAP